MLIMIRKKLLGQNIMNGSLRVFRYVSKLDHAIFNTGYLHGQSCYWPEENRFMGNSC